jgi:hypothetical protein
MKKLLFFLFLLPFVCGKLFAQNTALGCPDVVTVVLNTAPANCASATGSFTVVVGNRGANPAIVTINNFVDSLEDNGAVGDAFDQAGGLVVNTAGGVTFNGRLPGVYTISVKSGIAGTGICQTFTYNLVTAPYKANFANTPTNNTSVCGTAPNGSISLSGLAATDSVSWLASTTPVFTVVSALPAATISNLTAGTYYVLAKDGSGCSNVSTTTIVVGGNSPCVTTLASAARGAAAPQYCDNAESSNNLWENGTFGVNAAGLGTAVSDFKAPNSGNCGQPLAIIDPTGVYNQLQNGGAAALGASNSTSFQLQPLGAAGPTAGFYAITDNLNDGLVPGGCPIAGNHNVFDGLTNNSTGWNDGYDQDWYLMGASTQSGGFQMAVNGGSVPGIVIQQTINNLCPDENYQFSVWVRSLYEGAQGSLLTSMPAANVTPQLSFLLNGVAVHTTGSIPNLSHVANGANYTQYGFNFKPGAGSATIAIRSDTSAVDGQSNSFAIDDIYVGKPTPSPAYTVPSCSPVPTSVSAVVTDACNNASINSFISYQWMQNGIFVGTPQIGVLSSGTYTASYTPITIGDSYQLVVAPNSGDLASTNCNYKDTSNSLIITAGGCIILPIKLTSIKAQQISQNSGEIIWTVSSQANITQYVVEKSVDGGKTFPYTVATISVNNNTTSYTAEDDDLYTGGINYYRIMAVDADGSVSYSSIVTINPAPNTSTQIQIYPNPVNDELHISKPTNTIVKSVEIIDAIGQAVIQVNSFDNFTNIIPVGNLSTGFYDLKIIDSNNQVTNIKFIKK